MDMHYAYHPIEGARCVQTHEYYKLLEQGWYDTPTKFQTTVSTVETLPLPVEAPQIIEKKKPGRPKRLP